jgi:hypothetical protein
LFTVGEVEGRDQGGRIGVHQELRIHRQLVRSTGIGGVLHGVASR